MNVHLIVKTFQVTGLLRNIRSIPGFGLDIFDILLDLI